MIKKLKALWGLLHKGRVVANPAAWKTGQIGSNALAALLVALVHTSEAFGYEIPVTGEALDAIAVGLFAAINVVFTVIPEHSGRSSACCDLLNFVIGD